jgi:hypothetical protein
VFRDVNERIEENARRFSVGVREYVCECSRLGCAEMVTLASEEYEGVRAHPTSFLVAPGHVDERVEQVVGGADGRYEVVEKRGEAGRVAADLDERSDTT